MKIIREVLILSINSDWSSDLKKVLEGNPKLKADTASSRASATELLTKNEYEAIVIEDTFELKNMDYFLRALSTQQNKPKFVYFTFSESTLFNKVQNHVALNDVCFRFHSLPLPMEILNKIISIDLLPLDEATSSFDMEFTHVLIDAGQSVLKSLFVENINVLKPQLLDKMSPVPTIDIRGKIIIKSEFFSGSMFISFEGDVFKKLYKLAVGEEVSEITSEIEDFAGEIANMIYGQSKKVLERNGIKLDMAIPVVDREPKLKSTEAVFVIPLDTSVGPIYIKVAPNLY